MPETMTMTRDEIFETVREVLEEALGADEDEITMEASLTRDLEAESIDFLDIVFRLEKAFSTDDKPFKIPPGELFPENLMENPDWVHTCPGIQSILITDTVTAIVAADGNVGLKLCAP